METVEYMCHVGRYLVYARLDYVKNIGKIGGGWGGVVGWHGGNNRRVVKWQGGWIPVLFKDGERRLRTRYHHFVPDPNQQNEGAWCVLVIFAWPQEQKGSPSLYLTQAVRNMAGWRSVWILQSQTDLRRKLVTWGRPVYLVVAEVSTCVAWILMNWLMVILWVIMLWFHSWGVDVILGCGYGI